MQSSKVISGVKMTKIFILFLLLPFLGVNTKKYTDEDLVKLPKLYHLDDYERCLKRRDGLYCLGEFDLYSDVQPNPLYDLIKDVSEDVIRFNRTKLNRGYCLPTRCPGGEANATARFERCVDDMVRRRSLRARLRTLHYCRARGERLPGHDTNDISHTVLLYIVYVILFMNALGTAYDLKMGPAKDKNPYLMMFSLRVNCKILFDLREVNDPRKAGIDAMDGFKGFMLTGTVMAHCIEVVGVTWLYNIEAYEKILATIGPMFGALTTVTQYFIFFAIFVSTLEELEKSNKENLHLSKIPLRFLQKIIRIFPVYLLVTGFSATWSNTIGDGPLWPVIVGPENQYCRDKFWLHLFFLQNYIDPHKNCNGQTWVMSAIIHPYIPIMVIIYVLTKWPKHATRVCQALVVGATAYTTYVAVSNQYIPMFYYIRPKNVHVMFTNSRSFMGLFFSPSNYMITVAVAVWFAHHYSLSRKQAKPEKEPPASTLLTVTHNVSMLFFYVFCYIMSSLLLPYTDPVFLAILIPIERLVQVSTFVVFAYTSFRGVKNSFFMWKGFRLCNRMSMSISMVHWCVNKTLMASRLTLFSVSFSSIFQDTIIVFFASFVIAIPLTLLVDYPIRKLLNKLL